MAEGVTDDGGSTRRDNDAISPASKMPDIGRFIPATLAPRTPERPGVENYSLFVPEGDEDIASYEDLAGRVIDSYYGSPRRIDVRTTELRLLVQGKYLLVLF